MGKKDKVKQKDKLKEKHVVKLIGISRRGKKAIIAGIFTVIAGFIILTKADPSGQNWAGTLSPFFIIGGYAIIALGILLPETNIQDTAIQTQEYK